jgi:hypothetical protein
MIMRDLKLENKLLRTKYDIEKQINFQIAQIRKEEIIRMLGEMQEEEEEEMTYEELLKLGDEIGVVSKGFDVEKIESLKEIVFETSETCSICFNAIERGNLGVILSPCGHCYNKECIEVWLQQSKACPICLQEVTIG